MDKLGKDLKTTFVAASGAAIAFGTLAINAAIDAEQMRISFKSMLGSADKADTLMRDLTTFAKKTPFELTGLQESTKRLLAYGIANEDIMGNLKVLGDISSTVGMEKLPNLITAFGQVKAKTKLTGQELMQFTETGIPLIKELAVVTGHSVADITGKTANLGISFEQVQQALTNMTQKGGLAYNAMAEQSTTLGGMVSNLKDAWNQFLVGEGSQALTWAKDLVGWLIKIVEQKLPPFITTLTNLAKKVGENSVEMNFLFGAIALVLGQILLVNAAIMVKGLLQALQLLAVSTGAATTEMTLLRGAIAAIPMALTITVALIGFALVMSQIRELKAEIGKASDAAQKSSDLDLLALKKAEEFRKAGNEEAANRLKNVVQQHLQTPNFTAFATGGIVTKPTNALIGEAGPEAVIPLSKANRMGFGNVTIIVNGDISGEDLVDKVGDALTRKMMLHSAIAG